tara:strand:- start:996 stop:6944 length:5949 start_codon:yes stop_codon:yes gene_type:complete
MQREFSLGMKGYIYQRAQKKTRVPSRESKTRLSLWDGGAGMLSYRCSTDYPVRTGEVQFGTLSDDEIRRMSTVQVKDTTIYYRGLPNPYGINDHRMGTVDRRLLCGTCCRDVKECQGHVGHIELAFPMYHIGFLDVCFKTLRCVCFTCSRILLSDEEIANTGARDEGKGRFHNVYNTAKTRKKCQRCGMPQPNYVRQSLSIRCDWPSEVEWESAEENAFCTALFTQRDALSILSHISESDAVAMGFNAFCKPKDMIMCTVLVPPPVARPAIMASEGSRSRGQDDLTHKLQDINKRSIELQNCFKEGENWRSVPMTPELFEKISRLQFEVFTYINNNIRGQKQSTQRSGAPTKSITDRLKGKEGRIRGNLMGKRVDFSARSVITPDAVMDVDEVGIPYKVAMAMTVPVRVTSYNIEELTRRVGNGPDDIVGAESVITANGVMINLAHCENRDKIRLQFGWVVERFLTDNDIVIFNRQPSLHKVGMMGHRVKLMKGDTFRLNLCCANPYNADFDGDEMNLHVPQSPAAIADVGTIMMVSRQIISPQANRPVMGIVQDSLLGAHLFSSDVVLLNRMQACHIVAHLRYTRPKLPPPCVVCPDELWSGKQLMSLLFPPDFQYGVVPATKDLGKHKTVVVRDGLLLTGVLKKATMGTSSGGFVDVLYRQYGCVKTVRWMSDVQRLVNAWLCTRGFAVGVKDCVLGAKGETRVRERIETTMSIAKELIDEDVKPGTEEAQVLEGTVVRILSKCLMLTGGIVDEELGQSNAIRKMVQAGSKGNPINLSQICGCVGQQSVEGRRVFAEKGGRTLSCFEKMDNSLEGQGFVSNSYALGLHPHEYFFHAMGGREGLVDTAVKTATTGYIQRRQMKSMEDHKVYYDGTVRNASEAIVDFSYGGDGMDPTRVERVAMPMLQAPEDKLQERLTPWETAVAVECRRLLLRCKQLPFDARILLPFSPMRLYVDRDASPATASDEIEDRVRRAVLAAPSLSIRAAILDFFNTQTLVARGYTPTTTDALFVKLEALTTNGRVNAGEMVGSIAAQSIGEPCTQMSASHCTAVLVAVDGKTSATPIGALVDTYLPPVATSDQHDIVHVCNLRCLGVSSTENVAWANVTHVSRHPANGDMLTVTTERGRTLKMTASHSFLVRDKNRVVQRTGSDLVLGDCLPIVKDLPMRNGVPPWSPIPLDRATGRFVGAIVSEGTVADDTVAFANGDFDWATGILDEFGGATAMKTHLRSYNSTGHGAAPAVEGAVHSPELASWVTEHFGHTSSNMTLPAWILDAPDGFVAGVLQTYFDGDGNVQPEARRHRLCCRAESEELVTMLCLCLARFGIVTYVDAHKAPAGTRGATIRRVTIPIRFAAKFQEHIGFSGGRKAAKLADAVKEQEAVGAPACLEGGAGCPHIPGMGEVLEKVRPYVPPDGNMGSFETLQRKTGITPQMLMRCRERAVEFNAPDELVAELDQAIDADVWWDPIGSIEIEKDSTEMVYDFTVDVDLQSFMLANGVFVHNTLNTFHLAGTGNKNVTLGIPRLKELLDQTKHIKTPSNRIRFHAPFNQCAEFAAFFASTLPLTRLGDIVSHCDIVFDPDPHVTTVGNDDFMVALNERVGVPVNESLSRYVVRLVLAQSIMKLRRITPPMVRRLLRNRLKHKAHIISSETNSVEWIIRIRFERMREMMTPMNNRRESEGLLCHRVVSVMLDTIAISGHLQISGAQVGTEEKDGHTEHIVDTQGCSLIDLSAADCVDWYRTTTNDINEVHAALGIEATVNVLFSELHTTISFDGTYVDPRHIMMLVNTMTRGGYIMPLSRHGINRMGTGPLLRCSFEETPDILCDAACFGECDNGHGVSQNIMTGKLPDIGSGAMHIRVAPSMMHPRDTLSAAPRRKRVLKSIVRRRDAPVSNEIELHERERFMKIPAGDITTIEPPFAIAERGSVESSCSPSIFSSEQCQLPYTTDDIQSMDVDRGGTSYASPSTARLDYRPSSPQSDDDCA